MPNFQIPQLFNLIQNQLAHPNGENGVKIAENMNESNIQMTISSIDALNLLKQDSLLEIGHGNCRHLNKILNKAKDIQYFGLEISKTMRMEAERINQEFMLKKRISFHEYDGNKIPFVSNSFEKIFTVNTIYFWKNPLDFITEIYRVLKVDGIFVLTFAQKGFMKNLPFVKEKFSLYDDENFRQLIQKTDFEIIDIMNNTESVKSKAGDFVDREYSVIIMKK